MSEDTSRKMRRKEKNRRGAKRSLRLLRMVLFPLFGLSILLLLVYGLSNPNKFFSFVVTSGSTTQMTIEQDASIDVSTWEEFIAALSDKKITKITIKKNIEFPQQLKEFMANKLLRAQEEHVSYHDELAKQAQKRTIIKLSLIDSGIERKVSITGENTTINFGNIDFEIPDNIECDFQNVTFIRSYHY